MSPDRVSLALEGAGIHSVLFDRVGSTQDEAAELARRGAPSGTVVLARSQASGRGRMGRTWLSPEGGLYLSLVLRPQSPPSNWPVMTIHAGLGVVTALRRAGLGRAVLKWPNDCLVDGGKLCGLLAESFPDDGFIVVGLGMNVTSAGALADAGVLESGYRAVALADFLQADPDRVCADVIVSLLASIDAADRGVPLDTKALDGVLWSHGRVRVRTEEGLREGLVRGVDASGRLSLEMPDGSMRSVSSGEVGNACSD